MGESVHARAGGAEARPNVGLSWQEATQLHGQVCSLVWGGRTVACAEVVHNVGADGAEQFYLCVRVREQGAGIVSSLRRCVGS